MDQDAMTEIVHWRDIWVGRDGRQHCRRFLPRGDERRRYTWLRDLIEMHAPSPRRVLDVGCNIGEILRLLLADEVIEPGGAFGLDIDPAWIEQARGRCEGAAFYHVALEYAWEIWFPELSAIVASEIIEHLDDPLRGLVVLQGLLASGGLLLITTPDANDWARAYAATHPNKHRHIFDEPSLRELVGEAGLKVFDVERLHCRRGLVYLMMGAVNATS